MTRRLIPWRFLVVPALCVAGLLGCSSLPRNQVPDSEIDRRTAAHHDMGSKFFGAGQYDKAFTFFEKALILHASVDDRPGVAKALSGMGRSQLELGELDQAEAYFQQALSSAKGLPHPHLKAQALAGLGEVALHRQEPLEARAWFELGLELPLAEPGLERGVLLHDLGSALRALGDSETAETYYRQALAMNKSLRNPLGAAANYYSLALLLEAEGDREQAQQLARHALKNDKRAENPPGVAQDLSLLGSLAMRSGNLTAAADYYRRSKLAWQSVGRPEKAEEISRILREAGLQAP